MVMTRVVVKHHHGEPVTAVIMVGPMIQVVEAGENNERADESPQHQPNERLP